MRFGHRRGGSQFRTAGATRRTAAARRWHGTASAPGGIPPGDGRTADGPPLLGSRGACDGPRQPSGPARRAGYSGRALAQRHPRLCAIIVAGDQAGGAAHRTYGGNRSTCAASAGLDRVPAVGRWRGGSARLPRKAATIVDRPLSSTGPMTSCAIDGALLLSEVGFAAGTVLVEGRQIAAVAWSAVEREALRARAGTVVAAEGHWLIPGLVDGHAHGYAAPRTRCHWSCGPSTPCSTAVLSTRRHCARRSCSAPPSASAPASPVGSTIRR